MSDLTEFARLAVALEPWRKRTVFVGGWAYRLFRYHSLAYPPSYAALFTEDADIAFHSREPLALDGDIKEALRCAGFNETLLGEFQPPVAKYVLGDEAHGFYAEFLTPLTGSGIKRNGKPDATSVHAGISAQKLRHLEVLLHEPWVVNVPAADSGISKAIQDLRIPNPVSFIVQKVLIRDLRAKEKRSQDVLYIHDAFELFAASMDELTPLWESLKRSLTGKQRLSVKTAAKEMFEEITDTLREAAAIPSDRRPQPEDMLKLCQYGFGELFG